MDYEALGMQIRLHRKLKNMTQAQLAEKVGVTCAFIGHIERGTRKLSLQTLVSICDVLDVSSDELLKDSLHRQTPVAIPHFSEDVDDISATYGMGEKEMDLLKAIARLLSDRA